ncbi:MAG: arylamine N-acetyltransferase, partial [Rhizobacter sp.]
MIDLDAYTQRIGYTGPREASFEVLAALCALHPARIPYENIDPLLGITPSFELPEVVANLVHGQRVGYCFQQNLLLQNEIQ